MADQSKKIPQFPNADLTTLKLSGLTIYDDGITTYNTTLDTLKTFFSASGTTGTSGTSGTSGSSGATGTSGTSGSSGSSGSERFPILSDSAFIYSGDTLTRINYADGQYKTFIYNVNGTINTVFWYRITESVTKVLTYNIDDTIASIDITVT